MSQSWVFARINNHLVSYDWNCGGRGAQVVRRDSAADIVGGHSVSPHAKALQVFNRNIWKTFFSFVGGISGKGSSLGVVGPIQLPTDLFFLGEAIALE